MAEDGFLTGVQEITVMMFFTSFLFILALLWCLAAQRPILIFVIWFKSLFFWGWLVSWDLNSKPICMQKNGELGDYSLFFTPLRSHLYWALNSVLIRISLKCRMILKVEINESLIFKVNYLKPDFPTVVTAFFTQFVTQMFNSST